VPVTSLPNVLRPAGGTKGENVRNSTPRLFHPDHRTFFEPFGTGRKGFGGPEGDRNGNFKHGLWIREEVEARRAVLAQIRDIRGLLRRTE
jgi:hypothetical protein